MAQYYRVYDVPRLRDYDSRSLTFFLFFLGVSRGPRASDPGTGLFQGCRPRSSDRFGPGRMCFAPRPRRCAPRSSSLATILPVLAPFRSLTRGRKPPPTVGFGFLPGYAVYLRARRFLRNRYFVLWLDDGRHPAFVPQARTRPPSSE